MVKINLNQKLVEFFKNIVMGVAMLILSYLFVVSLFLTSNIDIYSEVSTFSKDNIYINLICILLILIFIGWLKDKLGKLDSKKLTLFVMILVSAFCLFYIFFVRAYPKADQAVVLNQAYQFSIGNYETLEVGRYMNVFAHQLGLVFILEQIGNIVGQNNYIFLQCLNVIFIDLIIFYLYKMCDYIFKKNELCNLTVLLSGFCIPLLLYTIFVYGNLPGCALSLMAIYYEIKYFKDQKSRYLILSIIFIAVAYLVRSNNLIILIAMIIAYFVELIDKKNALYILCIFITAISCFGLTLGVKKYYSVVSGYPINTPMPKTLWISMAINDNSPLCEGWYDRYIVDVYDMTNYDYDEANRIAIKDIKSRLTYFKNNPKDAIRFFSRKINSTWINPDFQSFWIAQTEENASHWGALEKSLFYGKINKALSFIMNISQTLIYLGALVFVLTHFKKIEFSQLALIIIFIGGFLFHIIWEAKSQYVITYFILLFPYASKGLVNLSSMMKSVLQSCRNKIYKA